MSSIYIQEPPSNGKVLLETTVGDIDIELWSKETPKACRNFVQLCVEGYYDGTLFHRIVKGFIAQGGDPTGTGTGGESIYGKPFKDEIHQRLRFVRRGLVAMANGGRDDNASQFFFTFQDAPELQGKHTIFGKVVGDTIYNMMKLEDTIVDKEDRPLYPQKLIRAKILSNPFDDIQPRVVKQEKPEKVESKSKSKGTKNFSLLSFGQEAEEDEEEVDSVTSIMKIKSKSSHDLTDDPSLSSVPAVDVVKRDHDEDVEALQEKLESIRKKLKRDDTDQKVTDESKVNADDNDDIEDKEQKKIKERDSIRLEVKKLKKELKKSSKNAEEQRETDSNSDEETIDNNEMIQMYKEDLKKYKESKKKQPKKADRQSQVLEMLSKFQQKLHKAHSSDDGKNTEIDEGKKSETDDGIDDNDDGWLHHEFNCINEQLVLAKDANLKNSETYEIFDPRNPMNKRRREADSKKSGSSSKSRRQENKHGDDRTRSGNNDSGNRRR